MEEEIKAKQTAGLNGADACKPTASAAMFSKGRCLIVVTCASEAAVRDSILKQAKTLCMLSYKE